MDTKVLTKEEALKRFNDADHLLADGYWLQISYDDMGWIFAAARWALEAGYAPEICV
jgi:hypothetical protein